MTLTTEDVAEYQCLACHFMWLGVPGPTSCPRCGHDYVKWINFEKLHKKWKEEGIYESQVH